MGKKINSKGQLFSVDLLVASVIFLAIITITIFYSSYITERSLLTESETERDLAAINTANNLVYSQGNPANWENLTDLNNVYSIGLSKTRNELDFKKTQRLVDLNQTNYDYIRDLLGVSKFGLNISILKLQDKSILEEFGLEPGVDAKVSSVNRFVIYNGENVILRVRVFKE